MPDSFSQTIVFTAISVLVPFFTSKAYNAYVPKTQISCNSFTDQEFENCRNKRDKNDTQYNTKRLTFMLIASFIYIILGFVSSSYVSNMSLQGISLGGLLLMLYNLFINWNLFDEKKQVAILGAILAGLLFFGTRINLNQLTLFIR